MDETILFCFVFLSQVLMISWFYPQRIISRSRNVLQNFPPSTHPKLYRQPPERYERRLRNFARFNLVIVVAGILVIGLILGTLVGGWDGGIFTSLRKRHWGEAIVVPFFLVQLVAGVVYMNISAGKKKVPPPRVRTAELHRRRLVDFVSPAMLVVTALANIAFIAFVLYAYQRLELPLFKVVVSIACVALALLVFSVTVTIGLRVPKLNPYQAQQDRHNMLKLVVQQALALCIAFPVLFAALLIIKPFESVMTSLFVQGIALALLGPSYFYRMDKVDFDVYGQDARDSTPDASARISSP
jgi:MFS family permease